MRRKVKYITYKQQQGCPGNLEKLPPLFDEAPTAYCLGIFQEGNNEDGIDPVAVVELGNGTVISSYLWRVKFIDR